VFDQYPRKSHCFRGGEKRKEARREKEASFYKSGGAALKISKRLIPRKSGIILRKGGGTKFKKKKPALKDRWRRDVTIENNL